MPSLDKIRHSVRTKLLRVENGDHFLGFIRQTPDTTRVTNMLSARRILQVHPNATVQMGDEIEELSTNQRWMCAEHGYGFYGAAAFYRHFKLFEVHNHVVWQRPLVDEDDLTGLTSSDALQTMSTALAISEEPEPDFRDDLRVAQDKRFIVTNKEILVGDVIDGMKAISVDHQLGLYTADLE